jgi:hypothetical protein
MIPKQDRSSCGSPALCLVSGLVVLFGCANVFAQSPVQPVNRAVVSNASASRNSQFSAPTLPPLAENGRAIAELANSVKESTAPESESPRSPEPQLRLETTPVANGAELLSIFGRMEGMRRDNGAAPEVPLISVLRDTLGDNDPENDRLRYVWMLSYTQPALMKRVAAAIPFLYQHVGNQKRVPKHPTPLIDLANVRRQTWNSFLWWGVQNAFLDTYGLPVKASTRNYRRNLADYRRGHVMAALSILSTYENLRRRTRAEGELLASSQPLDETNASAKPTEAISDATTPLVSVTSSGLTTNEMVELRARLIFSGKTFGGLPPPSVFGATVEKRSTTTIDLRGHNWEMLRQRAEAEGLYFEPLMMPDGSPTHALIWIAKSDLAAQRGRQFHGRFLNIAEPWNDQCLQNRTGYTQTRYFDSENRIVDKNDPAARPVEMIPLALYGLDHPKIPAVLIDFRNGLNPKKRELSRRILHDLAKNIFSLSSFGNIPYFLGRQTYDFITGRRGLDLNQPSRLESYAQLKLLLSFNGSIDPKLRSEIERLETISVNPLSNDHEAEIKLAQRQYDRLIEYARSADGLPARIERDRRTEMTPLKHGHAARVFFAVANVLTFGRYVHREKITPELTARLELRRRIQFHSEFLQEVAKSSPQIDVVWDMNRVRRSLQLLADQGPGAKGSTARAAARVFDGTIDDETRRLCLATLYKIHDQSSRNELLRLYREQPADSEWKVAIADHLRRAVNEDPRIKPAEMRAVLTEVGQPWQSGNLNLKSSN